MEIFGVRLGKFHLAVMGVVFFQSWVFIFSGAWALGGVALFWLLQNFLYTDSHQMVQRLKEENSQLKESIGNLLNILERMDGVTVKRTPIPEKEKAA